MEEGIGKVGKGIRHSGGASLQDVNIVTAAVVEGGAKVVAAQTMGSPRGTGVRVLVYHH